MILNTLDTIANLLVMGFMIYFLVKFFEILEFNYGTIIAIGAYVIGTMFLMVLIFYI